PPDNPAHRHTPGNSFLLATGGVFHGEGVPVTDDDGATVATGGEPEDRLPAHCNDRCPVHVVSAEPQPVQLHDAGFQYGYRTASGEVVLSEPADVLFPVHLLRSFLRHVSVQSAGRLPSLQPDSVAGLSDEGLQPAQRATFPALRCE